MENCLTMHRLSPGLTIALVLKRGNETGYRNKGRPRLCWIDITNENITSLGLALRGPGNEKLSNVLDK